MVPSFEGDYRGRVCACVRRGEFACLCVRQRPCVIKKNLCLCLYSMIYHLILNHIIHVPFDSNLMVWNRVKI
jgi:hypothetical protein